MPIPLVSEGLPGSIANPIAVGIALLPSTKLPPLQCIQQYCWCCCFWLQMCCHWCSLQPLTALSTGLWGGPCTAHWQSQELEFHLCCVACPWGWQHWSGLRCQNQHSLCVQLGYTSGVGIFHLAFIRSAWQLVQGGERGVHMQVGRSAFRQSE